LQAKRLAVAEKMNFELVLSEGMEFSREIVDTLTHNKCLSRVLYGMGFVILEAGSKLPVAVLVNE